MGLLTASLAFLGVVIYTYVGYPLILVLWVRIFGKRDTSRSQSIKLPSVSILVTVHNGEALVEPKLANLGGVKYSGVLDVNFVLDGCTDGTEREIRKAIAEGDFPFTVNVFSQAERKGKESAIRNALPDIGGEVLMFSDADAILSHSTIAGLVDKLLEDGVGVACGREVHHSKQSSGAGQGQGLFYRYEEFVKRYQEEVASLTYVQGGVFAMWRELYPEEIPAGATQDGIIAFNAIRNGKRVAFAADTLSEEYYDLTLKGDFLRRIRTISRAFYAICVSCYVLNPFKTGMFGFHLVSSRILRWLSCPMVIAANLMLSPLIPNSPVAKLIILVEALFLTLAVVGYICEARGTRLKLPYLCFYFCYIHVAAFVGLCRVVLGYRTTVWRPTQC